MADTRRAKFVQPNMVVVQDDQISCDQIVFGCISEDHARMLAFAINEWTTVAHIQMAPLEAAA